MNKINVWSQNCSQNCWHAVERECHCRCGGEFHGSGSGNNKLTKYLEVDKEWNLISDIAPAAVGLDNLKQVLDPVSGADLI